MLVTATYRSRGADSNSEPGRAHTPQLRRLLYENHVHLANHSSSKVLASQVPFSSAVTHEASAIKTQTPRRLTNRRLCYFSRNKTRLQGIRPTFEFDDPGNVERHRVIKSSKTVKVASAWPKRRWQNAAVVAPSSRELYQTFAPRR